MPKLNPGTPIPTLNGSLAEHLRTAGWAVYTEIPLGAAQTENVGRVDVLAIKKSYSVRIQAYECKVSRADFNRDVNSGKYQRYFKRVHQVYFACSSGLVKVQEVPADAGLITLSDNGWYVAKTAPVHDPGPVSMNLLLQCLFREQEEKAAARRLQDRVLWEENLALHDRAIGLGYEIRQKLREVDVRWAEIKECRRLLEGLVGKSEYVPWSNLVSKVTEYVETVKAADMIPLVVELVDIASEMLMPRQSLWRGSTAERLQKVLLRVRDLNTGDNYDHAGQAQP